MCITFYYLWVLIYLNGVELFYTDLFLNVDFNIHYLFLIYEREIQNFVPFLQVRVVRIVTILQYRSCYFFVSLILVYIFFRSSFYQTEDVLYKQIHLLKFLRYFYKVLIIHSRCSIVLYTVFLVEIRIYDSHWFMYSVFLVEIRTYDSLLCIWDYNLYVMINFREFFN